MSDRAVSSPLGNTLLPSGIVEALLKSAAGMRIGLVGEDS